MPIRIDPTSLVIRGYEAGVDIDKPLSEMAEDYKFVATVLVSEESVEIVAMHGEISLSDAKEIKRKLVSMGFTECHWRRASGKEIEVKGG